METVRATRYVSVSSAGTLGNAYFGVLDALEENLPAYDEWRRDLRGVAGCSAGCVMALCIALGLDKQTRREAWDMFDVQKVFRVADIALLVHRYGIDDGSALRECVQGVLERGGLHPRTSLGDLKRLLRVDFVCACTDVETSCAVHLSPSTHPDVLVCDAVVASCAMPFAICPLHVAGRTLMDGCLTCRLPTVFPAAETLFVTVAHTLAPTAVPVRGVQDMMCSVVTCSTRQQADAIETLARDHRLRFVNVDVSAAYPSGKAMDFAMDQATRVALSHAGHVSTVDMLYEGRVAEALHTAVCEYVRCRACLVTACESEDPPPIA